MFKKIRGTRLLKIILIPVICLCLCGGVSLDEAQRGVGEKTSIVKSNILVKSDYGEEKIREATTYINEKDSLKLYLLSIEDEEGKNNGKISEDLIKEEEDLKVEREGKSELSAENVCIEGISYDTLTDHEINLLEVVVQHEVGNLSSKYKELVAELLYNRLVSDLFPNTVEEMLYQRGAFQGISRWYSPDFKVDEETKAVVKKVFTECNPSHEAIAYYNPALSSQTGIDWFENSGDVEFLFEYAETSWGVVYNTRFFKYPD